MGQVVNERITTCIATKLTVNSELFYVIEVLKTRRRILTVRLSQESDNAQRELIKSTLAQTEFTLKDLERIFELCVEATK